MIASRDYSQPDLGRVQCHDSSKQNTFRAYKAVASGISDSTISRTNVFPTLDSEAIQRMIQESVATAFPSAISNALAVVTYLEGEYLKTELCKFFIDGVCRISLTKAARKAKGYKPS
ncbi:unnamed protein product [Dovyalis caffra]|uniref:Uncharacterized protein n=1 Tax=Dovyalis caffra TaxID=77055 RepID=A0AAV1RIY1_9ROSI|nr:unnamed protein product [Dovyalis caffra]